MKNFSFMTAFLSMIFLFQYLYDPYYYQSTNDQRHWLMIIFIFCGITSTIIYRGMNELMDYLFVRKNKI